MKIRATVIALVLMAGSCFAAEADGKWSGMVSTANGDIPVNFTFKAEGASLTGTTTGLDGSDVKIENGKADGKNISFSVTFDFGGMPLTIAYKGVVDGQQIKLTYDAAGMPGELTVKKAA